MSFDCSAIRREFPITEVVIEAAGNGGPRPLIYLDHAASTHPCRRVISGYTDFLAHQYANIHRGLHRLSMISTELFDRVSEVIAGYIGADTQTHCIVYTQNTTGALDLAAHVMADVPGITLSTEMEHHSNDLPHRQRGEVRHVRVTADGRLDLEHLDELLARHRVKLVAVTGASNVTGWMPDVHAIAARAHAAGARILVDAAQLLAHHPFDVKKAFDPGHLDFVAAAGHKAYAPFGAAFLCAPRELLDQAPPYQPGGGTVACVTPDRVWWLPSPDRHHGGTPNIPGVIAMASALEFLTEVGKPEIRAHELELLTYGMKRLSAIDGLVLYGPPRAEERLGVLSFNLTGIPHGVVSAVLNAEAGIATRNGRFCAHPYVHRLLGIDDGEAESLVERQLAGERVELPGAVRASFGIYNTLEEVDRLAETLIHVRDGRFSGSYDAAALSLCNPDLADLRFEA
jgi:cysteine desulfurase / selenocysteine lyase